MNGKQLWLSTVIVMAGILVLQPAWAHEHHDRYAYPGMSGPPWGNMAMMPGCGGWGPGSNCMNRRPAGPFAGLDLSAAQRHKIHSIFRENRRPLRQLRDQLTEKRHALYDLLEDDGAFDDKAAKALADEMGSLIAKNIVRRAKMRAEINKVLTAEQRDLRQERLFGGWYGGHSRWDDWQ